MHGFSLSATDRPWTEGAGEVVEGPIRALLMLVTGRLVVLPELSGPGPTSCGRDCNPHGSADHERLLPPRADPDRPEP